MKAGREVEGVKGTISWSGLMPWLNLFYCAQAQKSLWFIVRATHCNLAGNKFSFGKTAAEMKSDVRKE